MSDKDKWLTVSQAAQQLGISERQARRYASKLAPEDRDNGTDATPDTECDEAGQRSVTRPARRPARVRLDAMKAARDEATGRENQHAVPEKSVEFEAGHEPDTTTKRPDLVPNINVLRAGHTTGTAPNFPNDWEERAADYKEQIQFLRATVEQHQRSEAELRAALREALKAQPRQLTGGESLSTTPKAPVEAPSTAPEAAAPLIAKSTIPRETRQTQKRRAVRELLRAFLGIDRENG